MSLLRTVGNVANAFGTAIYNKTKGLLFIAALAPLAYVTVSLFVVAPLLFLFLCGVISAGYGIKTLASKALAERQAKKNPRIVSILSPPPRNQSRSSFPIQQRSLHSSFQNPKQNKYGPAQPSEQQEAEDKARRDSNTLFDRYNALNPGRV